MVVAKLYEKGIDGDTSFIQDLTKEMHRRSCNFYYRK